MYEDTVNTEDNKDSGKSAVTPTTVPGERPAGELGLTRYVRV
jgi:hypothetical protein